MKICLPFLIMEHIKKLPLITIKTGHSGAVVAYWTGDLKVPGSTPSPGLGTLNPVPWAPSHGRRLRPKSTTYTRFRLLPLSSACRRESQAFFYRRLSQRRRPRTVGRFGRLPLKVVDFVRNQNGDSLRFRLVYRVVCIP